MIRTWGTALALAGLMAAAGCHDNNSVVGVDNPPYVVDGVRSITGDGEVTITWRPNQESDIDHYNVYRNSAPTGTFTLIGSTSTTTYIDHNVVNGTTYYYAVAAVDRAGQESPQLSYENVFDTPRPEGFNVTLTSAASVDSTSGWDFSAETRRASTDSRTDIYYSASGGSFLVLTPSDTKIQDAGFMDLVDVDFGPPSGWSADGIVEAIPGHSYIVLTRDNHYAKFEVRTAGASNMEMDWAYQIDPGNPELAKRKLP